jgi:serine/threonine protein kinase
VLGYDTITALTIAAETGERVSEPALQLDLSLQVGKYEIQRAIGKGATGMVYLAKDTFTGREVALKTIEPEVFRDPEFGAVYRTQFKNEASLAGKLRHPYIVAILDAVVAEESGHIAMEYVKGGDLSAHVKPDKLLPVADVLQNRREDRGFRRRHPPQEPGRERGDGLAVLHVARADHRQGSRLTQRHVLSRRGAL